MTDPLERYAWKHQDYEWCGRETLPMWRCRACGMVTSKRKRHDSLCPYRERDTTRLKPAYAPNPWNKGG